MHVTKSPAPKLCFGAFLKKSFTRSLYPTIVTSGNFTGGFFRTSISGKFLGVSKKGLTGLSGICQVTETYIPVGGGWGVPPYASFKLHNQRLSNNCQHCHVKYMSNNAVK